MGPLIRIKGARVQQLEAGERRLTVSVPRDLEGPSRELALIVDTGALITDKQHLLMKLEDFQIGYRVRISYSPQPDGVLLAKAVILERRVDQSVEASPQ